MFMDGCIPHGTHVVFALTKVRIKATAEPGIVHYFGAYVVGTATILLVF